MFEIIKLYIPNGSTYILSVYPLEIESTSKHAEILPRFSILRNDIPFVGFGLGNPDGLGER